MNTLLAKLIAEEKCKIRAPMRVTRVDNNWSITSMIDGGNQQTTKTIEMTRNVFVRRYFFALFKGWALNSVTLFRESLLRSMAR